MSGSTSWESEPKDAREIFRAKIRDAISPGYSAAFHIGAPAVVGISLIAFALANLHHVLWWELFFPPFIYVLSNAVEHRAHRLALHRRMPGMTILYDRHTPMHHRIFIAKDMAIRDSRECALVLLPWFGIVAIFALTTPFTLLLWFTERNLACLFVATTMFYVLSYEWMHLAYHLSPTSFIGRNRVIRALRRHHATHHHPPLMQKWNFNVTVPLWDWVRGTTYPEKIADVQ